MNVDNTNNIPKPTGDVGVSGISGLSNVPMTGGIIEKTVAYHPVVEPVTASSSGYSGSFPILSGQPVMKSGVPVSFPNTIGQPGVSGLNPLSSNIITTPSSMSETGDGTFIFRPLEGKFLQDQDIVTKMDPYCKIKLGWKSGKTAVSKNEGTNPVWTDAIVLPRKLGHDYVKIKVSDKDKLISGRIGDTKINLDEVLTNGRVAKWYPIYKKGQVTGEVLLDIEFSPLPIK